MTVAATNGSASTSDPLALARQAAVPNSLKECVTSGRLAHSFSIKLVKTVEIVHYAAAAGYDAVLIDLEHSSFGLETTNQLSCAALQVGYVRDHLPSTSWYVLEELPIVTLARWPFSVTPIVRVPANTSDWISRALDGGAAAVIVPHVNSVAEAENVVRYAKFAPLGERSATSGMPILRYNSVPAKYANPVANDATVVICMIETERALEIAEWVQYDRRGKIE
jgi:2-keto-3-deoxy-L-rhamnonate aldolase RhmA